MPRLPTTPSRLPEHAARDPAAARLATTPWSTGGLEAAREAAESLLGGELRLLSQEPARLSTLRDWLDLAAPHAARFALGLTRTGEADATCWLELDAAGAGLWVERLLGGDGLDAPVPMELPLDAMAMGVLGYLVARTLAAHGSGLALDTLGTEPTSEQRAALGVGYEARLLCEQCACRARLWAPLALPGSAHPAHATLAPASAASALEVVLVADAGSVCLGTAQLATLEHGDVVLLDRMDIELSPAGVRGRTRVHDAEGGPGAILCCVRDGALVVEAFERIEESNMTEAKRIPATDPQAAPASPALAALADVPVQLSLELGRFALTLHELSALQPGDVLASGLELERRVALRAGGQLVATGELVELDGELGVRIEALAGR